MPKVKESVGLSDSLCEEYTVNFGELYPKLPKQIIHRDPNPSNIITCDDKWGFIDFELSEKNVRIFDPCYAATAILSETFAAMMKTSWRSGLIYIKRLFSDMTVL